MVPCVFQGIPAWYGPAESCMQKMSLVQELRAMESSVGIQRRHRHGTYFEGSLTVKRLQTVLLSKAFPMQMC